METKTTENFAYSRELLKELNEIGNKVVHMLRILQLNEEKYKEIPLNFLVEVFFCIGAEHAIKSQELEKPELEEDFGSIIRDYFLGRDAVMESLNFHTTHLIVVLENLGEDNNEVSQNDKV